jgi:hypothetical protein
MSVRLFSDHLSESCLITPSLPRRPRQATTIRLATGTDLYRHRRGSLQALCQMHRIFVAMEYVCSEALRELVY